MSEYKKLIGGKKLDKKRIEAEMQKEELLNAQKDAEQKYGSITVNKGTITIQALDDWGNVCYDALMLSIPVAKEVDMYITSNPQLPGVRRFFSKRMNL